MSPSGPSAARARFTSVFVLPHALASVRRAVRHRQLQALVAELDVLLDVVARAVGRNPVLRLAAEQFVDRHPERVADQVPQRQIDAADRVHRDAHAAVVHGGAPHDVPQPLDIERVFAEQQFRQVAFHHDAADRSAAAVALDAFVGRDLHREPGTLPASGKNERSRGLVLRVDRHRVGDFHVLRTP